MQLEKKAESYGIVDEIRDILDTIGDGIGLVASPATFWLLVLYNSSGRGGFDGYVTNPPVKLSVEQKVQPTPGKPESGVPTAPTSEPTIYDSYGSWLLASDSLGNWYIYTLDHHIASGAFSSEDAAKAYIDSITPTTPTGPTDEVFNIEYRGFTIIYTKGIYSLNIPERHIASTFTTLLGAQKFIDNLLLISV